ncbi:hypothetical protein [Microcella sp.]|uniref:hypothetical protein n=1 Tax=Microcella sp. TaxID=1913979 RepID=UPI00256CC074|nr:hypothetical protein [Microcella sp.]MBX9470990.1 hypothetical protein [Microcella sp.]
MAFKSLITVSTTLATALLLVGCSPESASTDEPGQAIEETESTETNANGESATGGGLDSLEADSLHDAVEPAAAGTAYIEIAGERLDFAGVECTADEREGAETVQFIVQGDTAYGRTELSLRRGIGPDLGFNYEEELVQVTHIGGTGGRELNDISNAQNGGDEDGSTEWFRGDGPDPMIRIVGSDISARGTLAGLPGAENPHEGEFVLAANCG